VGAVLRAVLALRLLAVQRREVREDGVCPLEPLGVVGHEQRDLMLALPLLLPRRDLLRHEIDAELSQPLAHGGRVGAPLGLVERQHQRWMDGTPVA